MAFFVQKNALEQVNARSTNDNIKKVPTLRNVDDFCQSIFWPSKSFTDPEAVVRTCSVKNAFLEILQISLESLMERVAGLRPALLLKKRLQHMSFPVHFSKL